jgi:hypothetical protein
MAKNKVVIFLKFLQLNIQEREFLNRTTMVCCQYLGLDYVDRKFN